MVILPPLLYPTPAQADLSALRSSRASRPKPKRVCIHACPHSSCTQKYRRDGRAVEGARLESVYTGKTCIEGSNPSLSANEPQYFKRFRVLNQERLIQPANPPTSERERSYPHAGALC